MVGIILGTKSSKNNPEFMKEINSDLNKVVIIVSGETTERKINNEIKNLYSNLKSDDALKELLTKYKNYLISLYLPSLELLPYVTENLLGTNNNSLQELIVGKNPSQAPSTPTRRGSKTELQEECSLENIKALSEALKQDKTLKQLTLNATSKPAQSAEMWDILREGLKANKTLGVFETGIDLESDSLKKLNEVIKHNDNLEVYAPLKTKDLEAKEEELRLTLRNKMIKLADTHVTIHTDEFEGKILEKVLIDFRDTQKKTKLRLSHHPDKIDNLTKEKMENIFRGLKEATNFTEIYCNGFYPLDKEKSEIFYKGFASLPHLKKLTLSDIGKQDTLFRKFVKEVRNITVLSITSTISKTLEKDLIEDAKTNPIIMEIQVNGFSHKFKRQATTTDNKQTPAPVIVETLKVPHTPSHTPLPPSEPITTPTTVHNGPGPKIVVTPPNNNPTAPTTPDNIRNFINKLLLVDPKEIKGSFSYRILAKENNWKEQIADKLCEKISGNNELSQLLNDQTKADQMAYNIIKAMSYVKPNGAKIHNIGLWNGASFVDAISSFFYSLMQVRYDYGKSLYDWTFNHPILVIENQEQLIEALISTEQKADGANRYKIEELIGKAAEKCGLSAAPARAQ